MAVTARDKTILWGRAAARCAYPGCRKQLVTDPGKTGKEVVVGEVAHIVARSSDGPRGDQVPPGGDRDGQPNLILLCRDHHGIIDQQPGRYPVATLLQWKKDHEAWVNNQLFPRDQLAGLTEPAASIQERVYSTLLPVQHIPGFVHLAPCTYSESEVQQSIDHHAARGMMAPFIVRGGNLLTFCDLDDETNPFRLIIDPYSTEKHHADAWWDDPDHSRWYVDLLNRTLNKLTGRLGLNLDKEHRRYYFEPDEDDCPRSVSYRSVGGRKQTRYVVRQPTLRATGEKRHYWEHLAVRLRFQRTAERSWCLSIRPERRFTRDGKVPLTPRGIGRRSTSRKSHMYNIDVLGEIHFWRHYLSQGQPRIIMKFGRQSIVLRSDFLSTDIKMPAIPDDTARHLTMKYEDDLFSLTDYLEAVAFEDENELDPEGFLNEGDTDDT